MTTKMTKAQLVDENIALRAQCDVLERRIAALEAAQTQPPAVPCKSVGVFVGSYTKQDGSVWNKFRTGPNQITHRPQQLSN